MIRKALATPARRRRFLVLMGVAGVALAFWFRHSWSFELISLERILRAVEMARANFWITALFYLLFVLGVMALPITLFPIVGGVLCPFWIALPLNVVAATAGAWLSFAVSRRFGRRLVEPFLRGKLKSWDRLAAVDGFKTVSLLRFVGVPPFLVSNYALGLSAVKHRDFVLGTLIGMLPWMGLVTYASDSLWQAVQIGGREGLSQALFHAMAPLMIISGLVMAVMVGSFLWRRGRRRP